MMYRELRFDELTFFGTEATRLGGGIGEMDVQTAPTMSAVNGAWVP